MPCGSILQAAVLSRPRVFRGVSFVAQLRLPECPMITLPGRWTARHVTVDHPPSACRREAFICPRGHRHNHRRRLRSFGVGSRTQFPQLSDEARSDPTKMIIHRVRAALISAAAAVATTDAADAEKFQTGRQHAMTCVGMNVEAVCYRARVTEYSIILSDFFAAHLYPRDAHTCGKTFSHVWKGETQLYCARD